LTQNYVPKFILGFCTRFTFNQNSTKIEIPILADNRNYNLLLLASEAGNSTVVENLLEIGLREETADQTINAQSLAWQGRHSDVLMALAQYDLKYPVGIDVNQLSDKFKSFYKRIEDFHAAIRSNNVEKVKKVIYNNNNGKLKYFFNTDNASAAYIAIQAKAFATYEILLANGISLLRDEKIILKELKKREQRQVREIHTKYSKDLKDKHISILMAYSYTGHNVSDPQEKLKIVKKAYELLSQDSRLNVILKVAATSRKLKIVYDFNNESVDSVDPTTSAYTEGVFYPTGRIYIGAKQLLNEETKYKTLSTIAHELGHYAMNLTYENNAKPYRAKNTKGQVEFFKIFNDCAVNAPNEPFVHLVYEVYPKEVQHAELIVRAPHLIALYLNQPEKLKEVINLFPKLYEFYEQEVIPDMMRVLPEIEDRTEKRIEKLFKEKKKLKIFLGIGFFLMILIGMLVAFRELTTKPYYIDVPVIKNVTKHVYIPVPPVTNVVTKNVYITVPPVTEIVTKHVYITAQPVTEKVYITVPPVIEKVYITVPPIIEKVYITAPPVTEKVYKTTHPVTKKVHTTSPSVTEKLYTTVPPVTKKVYTTVTPVTKKVYTTAPPVTTKHYTTVLPVTEKVNKFVYITATEPTMTTERLIPNFNFNPFGFHQPSLPYNPNVQFTAGQIPPKPLLNQFNLQQQQFQQQQQQFQQLQQQFQQQNPPQQFQQLQNQFQQFQQQFQQQNPFQQFQQIQQQKPPQQFQQLQNQFQQFQQQFQQQNPFQQFQQLQKQFQQQNPSQQFQQLQNQFQQFQKQFQQQSSLPQSRQS